jgi:hypothetical protein
MESTMPAQTRPYRYRPLTQPSRLLGGTGKVSGHELSRTDTQNAFYFVKFVEFVAEIIAAVCDEDVAEAENAAWVLSSGSLEKPITNLPTFQSSTLNCVICPKQN